MDVVKWVSFETFWVPFHLHLHLTSHLRIGVLSVVMHIFTYTLPTPFIQEAILAIAVPTDVFAHFVWGIPCDYPHNGPVMLSFDVYFMVSLGRGCLSTHLPRVPHICVSELLVAWSAPSHYLNQYWLIGNWTLRNKLQWNQNQNVESFSFMKMHLKMSSAKWVKKAI